MEEKDSNKTGPMCLKCAWARRLRPSSPNKKTKVRCSYYIGKPYKKITDYCENYK